MKIHPLRRGQQFDADDIRRIGSHFVKSPRAVRRHADMVLLVGGSRDAVDRSWMCKAFIFAGERRRRDMRDHEAGIDPRVLDQKRRQAANLAVYQHGDTALAHIADFGNRQGKRIRSHRNRLGVEIAARFDFAGIEHNEGIVGHSIRFPQENIGRKTDMVQACTHHLRHAADGIRILHTLIMIAGMAGTNGAVLQQVDIDFRDINLTFLTANLLDIRIERRA